MTAEYSYLTCCLCEKEIDPSGWYASYSDDHKAHSECWQKNALTGHSQRPVKSKFRLVSKQMERLAAINPGCELLPVAP